MNMMLKRTLGFISGIAISTFIFWMGGYDFTRGDEGWAWSLTSLASAALIGFFPFEDSK